MSIQLSSLLAASPLPYDGTLTTTYVESLAGVRIFPIFMSVQVYGGGIFPRENSHVRFCFVKKHYLLRAGMFCARRPSTTSGTIALRQTSRYLSARLLDLPLFPSGECGGRSELLDLHAQVAWRYIRGGIVDRSRNLLVQQFLEASVRWMSL